MSELPPLPEGYALDQLPPLPKGYRLNADPVPAAAASGDDVSALSAARGIPLLGAGSDKAAAALRSLVRGGSVAENQKQIGSDIDAYEQAHPVENVVGKMTAGTLATAPLAAAALPAKALGLTGTTGQMMLRGGASGMGIGAADSALRGENPVTGALVGGGTGVVLPGVARGIGGAARGIRNLVSEAPRTPHTVDLNGNTVPVSKGYLDRDNATGSQEQMAASGALGEGPQKIAQTAMEDTHAATNQAAEGFGNEMRGGPGPSQPPGTNPAAAGQTVTELAQQHNDQISAQARQEASHEAQIAAEGAGLRGDIRAPLGAPETLPRTSQEAVESLQAATQRAEEASRQNYNNLYRTASQVPGNYHPAAFAQVGKSVRDQIFKAANARGEAPAIVNEGLTPNAQTALNLIDQQLGQNYVPNSVRRGDMVLDASGRAVPRPLTPQDVESVRKQLVMLNRDARASQARGGSGTDAYATQRILDAFNRHHDAVLQTPGAFRGDAKGYQQAIDNARAAFAEHKQTFANQRQGDQVGPAIEKIVGAHNAEPLPAETMANTVFGPANNPGGGNSPLIAARLRDIHGANSPAVQTMRQGVISHILETPEGMADLPPGKQADRLAKYAGSQHARELFTPEERTRMLNHANDLRAQAAPRPQPAPPTTAQAAIAKKVAEGNVTGLASSIFGKSGEISAGAEQILKEVKGRVSQKTWNTFREEMWNHLLEKPEGLVEWGPREKSNRLSRFLDSPAAEVLYDERERNIMRQFQQHYDRMAPLPNTTNPSGSAVMGAKLMHSMSNHIGALVGGNVGSAVLGPVLGHATGAAVGAGAQKLARAMTAAQQVAKTKELFLGKSNVRELNRNYQRAAAVLAHAATPAVDDHHQ
jgi:hypothetical protein